LFLFFLLQVVPGKYNEAAGQDFSSMEQAEDTLSSILASINRAGNDSVKNLLNQDFSKALLKALDLPASDNYPFASLKTLARIAPQDNKFRIYHWNLPSASGRPRYFGFLKLQGHDPPKIFPLTDFSDSLTAPDTALLDCHHWLGALYYQVIPCEMASGEMIYTLLGWAGRNPRITTKIIEILYFDGHGDPHFGRRIFPDYMDGNMTRIIFRYAATTSMSLKYEDQVLPGEKKWNSRKREFESAAITARMIVFDRLVPLDPQLEGQYQFYVPGGDVAEGFIFDKHCWKYMSGMDIRNKK